MPIAKENLQVRIARITAYQAVAVALVTAVGGIFAGYVAHDRIKDATASNPRRYLTIERLEAPRYTQCRIVISVNGYNYSYPSTAVFARVGSEPHEHFALPDAATYRIAFRAIVPEGGDAMAADSPLINEHSSAQSARDQIYEMYPGVMVRGPQDSADVIRLHYSIE